MAGSRANWEAQTGGEERLSSFERSKRDIADNVAKVKRDAERADYNKSVHEDQGGLIERSIGAILTNKARTKRYGDEVGK
jgi:uncharacterized protein YllA (UPF0747 family)